MKLYREVAFAVGVLLMCVSEIFAQYGNIQHQEVGDVVFRKLIGLSEAYEVHGGIYKGYFRRYGDAENDLSHDVIEMTGVTRKKLCHTFLWDNVFSSPVCVKSWEGIQAISLDAFKRETPPYYGAFSLRGNNLGKVIRAQVLDEAETLMYRDPQIPYVVIEEEPITKLLTNYFSYSGFDASRKILERNIVRMRSDAFVEYCYAAVDLPILEQNIRTVDGADALIAAAGSKALFPTNQRAAMMASLFDTPELAIFDQKGIEITEGGVTSSSQVSVNTLDFMSGL